MKWALKGAFFILTAHINEKSVLSAFLFRFLLNSIPDNLNINSD